MYAGGGFGVPGDATSGLLIDSTVLTNFGFEGETKPSIGSIFVGTAVSGQYYRFSITGGWDTGSGVLQKRIRAGLELGDDAQGYLVAFQPKVGEPGASISYVRSAATDQLFNINGLYAGDGGPNAPGGDITDVTLRSDDAGGYNIIAGNGGDGTRGGAGGAILRFSDVGSDTSKVVIKTGDGGAGSTGTGGNAGNIELVNANFYGFYTLLLGDGGEGFTQGGNGASLSKADINQPTPAGYLPGTAWGTSHAPSNEILDPSLADTFQAAIGTSQAIDIDGDGFGDYVYTTTTTSQLVVLFGDGEGGFRTVLSPGGIPVPDRIYLASPRNAEAMVVADLNGDGHPDIAAASGDASSQAGISVFLSKWEDINKDGDVTDAGVDKFLGFYDPRVSPLPVLTKGDEVFVPPLSPFIYLRYTMQVSDLVAGDFDGDGANELAVVVNYEVDDSPLDVHPVVIFMTPDREVDTNSGKTFLTGNFYADFGTKRVEIVGGGNAPAQPLVPFLDLKQVHSNANINNIILEATALSDSSDHDTLIVGVQGSAPASIVASVDFYDRSSFATPTLEGAWDLGSVDTNRGAQVASTPIGLLDFAMVDLDMDGDADLIGLSQSPDNYVVGVYGNGGGSGVQVSGDGANQSGYFLGDIDPGRGIKAVDSDGDAIVDDYVVLRNSGTTSVFNWRIGPQLGGSGPIAAGSLGNIALNPSNYGAYRDSQVIDGAMWDLFYVDVTDLSLPGVGGADPDDGGNSFGTPFSIGFEPLAEPGITVFAGDGGNSFAGKAGNGGFIGGKGAIETIIVDPTNNITTTDYFGSVQIVFDGTVQLYAGNGGLGFSKGGNGGSITGVSYRDIVTVPRNDIYHAFLVAGDGGRGISGSGGFGGDLIANSIEYGAQFLAGDGGSGKFGGRGGSLIGTNLTIGTTKVYDTRTEILQAAGGNGGNGLKGGGAGGSIVNFSPLYDFSENDGRLSYVAGHGGNAVGGIGGAGGSIINSSPDRNAILELELYMEAGRGGDGTRGGAGGSVRTFSLTQDTRVVAVASILAGHGGNGTTGAGGIGGSVSAINVASVGSALDIVFPLPTLENPNPSFFSYSRVLAGDGGNSFGGTGGAGGNISSSIVGVTDGTIAVVAGAGGAGLKQGGAGGSVLGLKISGLGAGTASKGLIVGGAGGDARAFIANPNDPSPDQALKAFGGRVGRGGAGGGINGVTATGADGAHMDMIAGDGGSTIHYGNIYDKTFYVGRGGSIQNIIFNGDIGNTNALAAIKSYNDVLNGETMQEFIERRVRVGESTFETLSDIDGNVGFVVGSAGRNKAVVLDPVGAPYEYTSQPATGAKNGSLINVSVPNIMSAVAGSVDRLARIQLVQNIFVPGKVGTQKGDITKLEFIDAFGVPKLSPDIDGRLIDGALYAKNIVGSPNLDGNIFGN